MLKTFFLCAGLALAGGAANASPFHNIVVDPAPKVSVSDDFAGNFAGFFLFGPSSADLVNATTPVSDGLAVSIAAFIAPDLTFTTFGTELGVNDGSSSWLAGDLSNVAYTEDTSGDDTIHLLFGNLTGPAAGEFGGFAVASVIGEYGPDPFGTGAPLSTGLDSDLNLSAARVIPLPAGLALLLTGLAALVPLARRRGSR